MLSETGSFFCHWEALVRVWVSFPNNLTWSAYLPAHHHQSPLQTTISPQFCCVSTHSQSSSQLISKSSCWHQMQFTIFHLGVCFSHLHVEHILAYRLILHAVDTYHDLEPLKALLPSFGNHYHPSSETSPHFHSTNPHCICQNRPFRTACFPPVKFKPFLV